MAHIPIARSLHDDHHRADLWIFRRALRWTQRNRAWVVGKSADPGGCQSGGQGHTLPCQLSKWCFPGVSEDHESPGSNGYSKYIYIYVNIHSCSLWNEKPAACKPRFLSWDDHHCSLRGALHGQRQFVTKLHYQLKLSTTGDGIRMAWFWSFDILSIWNLNL